MGVHLKHAVAEEDEFVQRSPIGGPLVLKLFRGRFRHEPAVDGRRRL